MATNMRVNRIAYQRRWRAPSSASLLGGGLRTAFGNSSESVMPNSWEPVGNNERERIDAK